MDIRVPKQKRILKCACVLNLSDTYMLCKQTTRFAALIFYFFYDSIIYIFSFPASKYCAKLISLYKSSYFFHQNFSDSFWLWSSKHARCYNLHLFGQCLRSPVIFRLTEGNMSLAPLMNFVNLSHLLTLPSCLLPRNQNPSMTWSRSKQKQ